MCMMLRHPIFTQSFARTSSGDARKLMIRVPCSLARWQGRDAALHRPLHPMSGTGMGRRRWDAGVRSLPLDSSLSDPERKAIGSGTFIAIYLPGCLQRLDGWHLIAVHRSIPRNMSILSVTWEMPVHCAVAYHFKHRPLMNLVTFAAFSYQGECSKLSGYRCFAIFLSS